MLHTKLALTAVPVLGGALNVAGAFFGCCDPPKPPAPSVQHTTSTEIKVDVAEIAKNMPKDTKVVVTTSAESSASSAKLTINLAARGGDLSGKIEQTGVATTVVLERFLKGRNLGRVGGLPGSGVGQIPIVEPGGDPIVQPEAYKLWISPPVTGAVFSSRIVTAIEAETTPLRFGFSFPFSSVQELYDSGIDTFFVEALDSAGNNVFPAGVDVVSTPNSEWPITSRTVWPTSQPPVLSISMDIVDSSGNMLTPTQLGMDTQEVTFRFGFSTRDLDEAYDFNWQAGLYRTEIDASGLHYGKGMWLGWHGSSLENIAPINEWPSITAITDLNGQPLNTISAGTVFGLIVDDGLPDAFVEISSGGLTFPILASAPGAAAGEWIYVLQAPQGIWTGAQSLFFRNIGATPRTLPTLVPHLQAGYAYAPLTIQ